MSRRVLVLGASGFIGARLAAAFADAGWTVRAAARRPGPARRRAPAYDWVGARFEDLRAAVAWGPLLDGVDVVVNAVGVLQDGAGDSLSVAHVEGPRALIEACAGLPGLRLIHISAAGVDATTRYAITKRRTEQLIEASGLDWVIVRPSLVMDRAAYGGTALMRGLAAFPGVIPVVGGDQLFRPIAMDDLCEAVVRLATSGAGDRRILDATGPQQVSLADILRAQRAWLGLPPAPVLRTPRWLASPVVRLGDVLGALGWPSSLRTTSLRQMDHDAAGGPPDAMIAVTGVTPQSLVRMLSRRPATVQDVWHARLQFVRPVSIVVLGLFWLITGLVTLGPGWEAAQQVLRQGGVEPRWVWPIAFWGAWLDIALGLALFVRRWTRWIALFMCLVTVGYLAAGTLLLPELWTDPLGPWLKVLPMMALCLWVAATDARR